MSLLRPTMLLLLGACSALLTAPALAQSPRPFEWEDGLKLRTAEQSAASGVFLRSAESPTTEAHRAAVSTHAGFDGNRQGALVETRGEVVLVAPSARTSGPRFGLSVVGGGAYIGATSRLPESSSGFGGLKLQPVFQDQLGFDAAVSVSYLSRGFNLQQALQAELLLGRRIGDTQLLLNVGYGHGLEEGERYGRLRAAVLSRVVKELRLGLEARGMLDLERDEDEPSGEPDFEVNGGAVVSYTISHLSLSASAGPAALKYRDGRDTMFGVAASFGIGAAL